MRTSKSTRTASQFVLHTKITQYREAKGWTMNELAQRLEVNPSTITLWEREQMGVADNMKIKLCKVFKCGVLDLFDWSDK